MVWRPWKGAVTWVALWTALVTLGCRETKQSGNEDLVPGLTLEGVHFRVYRGSALRATGHAARVDYRREADDLLARNLTATLPDPARGDVRLSAAQGMGKLRAGTFFASGGLELQNAEAVGRTASARYEPGPPAVIRGEEPVTVDGATWQLAGPGFTLDPATGDLSMSGGVRLEAQEAGER